MARIDKYDPVSGGFRAPLNANYTGAAAPIGVGLNSSGRVVAGPGQTGIIGVVCAPGDHLAGEPIDCMTNGELVEFAGVAGTIYFAHATTGVISSTPSIYRIGATVQADRLVVRLGPVIGSEAGNVVGDQTGIADASVAHALNATFSDTEVEAALNALGAKINAIIAALEAAGLLAVV